MTTEKTINPQGKAQLMKLLALGFMHPSKKLYPDFVNGEWQAAVSHLISEIIGGPAVIPLCKIDFEEFEANYIDLFQVGLKGRPLVSLNAADYNDLLDGQTRPEFLLDYLSWYKHFGLGVDDEELNLLADHICPQLEFLAWLSHLEGKTSNLHLELNYKQAQFDFIDRHFKPFISRALTKTSEQKKSETQEFFLTLFDLTFCAILSLEKSLGLSIENLKTPDSAAMNAEKRQTETVNLWD